MEKVPATLLINSLIEPHAFKMYDEVQENVFIISALDGVVRFTSQRLYSGGSPPCRLSNSSFHLPSVGEVGRRARSFQWL
jgi:hypothetical protein